MSKDNERDIVAQVKRKLRDSPEYNRVMGNKDEYTPEDVMLAAQDAVDEINEFGPYKTKLLIHTAPISLLLKGTIAHLLKARIAEKIRNTMTVSDGGIALNREGNLDKYEQLLAVYNAEFYDALSRYKADLNIRSGFRWA